MSVSDFYQTFQCSNIERKESGNTDRLNRNLYVILKFTKRTKIPRITLKKKVFSKMNQLFDGDFHGVLDEITTYMLQFTKK